MPRTSTDLAEQVLRELMKLDAIEVASAEDDSYIKQLSASYHQTLPSLRVNVTWDSENIPDAVFLPLAAVLADVASRSYGVAVSPSESNARLEVLRSVAAFPYLGIRMTTEFPALMGRCFGYYKG